MDIWKFPSRSALTATVFPDGKLSSVFAILDSAVWENLPNTLSDCGATYCLLTRQKVSHGLMHTLPYLVELKKNTPFAEVVINQIGSKKGIFLRAEGDSGIIYDLFDDLVMVPHVRLPNGADGWFRFYDPSVLGAFLSFATEKQIAMLFGKSVTEFLFESEFTSSIRSYSRPDFLNNQKFSRIELDTDQIALLDDAQHEYVRLQIMKRTWREVSIQKTSCDIDDPRPALSALLDIAEDSGITQYKPLQDFALLATTYGLNFTDHHKVRDFLNDSALSETKKVREIEAILANLTK